MSRSRFALTFACSIAFGCFACIDEPSFVLDESASSVSPTTPVGGEGAREGTGDDAMVLVPAMSIPTQGTLAPNAPGSGNGGGPGKGKGKGPGGGGGGDGGGEDPGAGPDSPAPAESTIDVPAFWIDVHEVRARAYAACVAAGACSSAGTGGDCTAGAGLEDHPANCVSIDQARAFCAWRGKRLVRNDEWTAASAGAQLRPYPWGAEAPSSERLNACGADECGGRSMYREADGFRRTAPAGSFAAGRSPEGVADLAGNVAEWVDLAGTSIARGGSYADHDVAAVSSLSLRPVSGADPTVGFRCAKDP